MKHAEVGDTVTDGDIHGRVLRVERGGGPGFGMGVAAWEHVYVDWSAGIDRLVPNPDALPHTRGSE